MPPPCRLLMVCLTLTLIAGTVQASDGTDLHSGLPTMNLRNPAAIEDVKNGRIRVASADWWGFDAKDATDSVQNAINSGAAKVVIPYVGQPWVVRPLHLKSNQEILFEPGVVLLAKEGEFRGAYDCLVHGQEVENVTLLGYGATLRMRKADYTKVGYAKAEWRHTLGLKGAKNVKVLGLSFESSGGDGIYIGSTWDNRRIPCLAILIRDCVCRDNHRQGISVISVAGLRIENCLLQGTRGTEPQSGIDFEPDVPIEQLSDIEMTNCVLEGNAGQGILVCLSQLDATSRKVSLRVVNSLVRSSGASGVFLALRGEGRPKGSVEFIDCTFENADNAGARFVWNADAPMKVRFANCRWQNVARGGTQAPIQLEFHGVGSAPGAVQFSDCYAYDDKPRPAVQLLAPEAMRLQDTVTGVITIFNERATNADPQVSRRLPQLQTQQRKRGE